MSMGGVHLGFYAMSRLLKAPLWSMFICKRRTAMCGSLHRLQTSSSVTVVWLSRIGHELRNPACLFSLCFNVFLVDSCFWEIPFLCALHLQCNLVCSVWIKNQCDSVFTDNWPLYSLWNVSFITVVFLNCVANANNENKSSWKEVGKGGKGKSLEAQLAKHLF